MSAKFTMADLKYSSFQLLSPGGNLSGKIEIVRDLVDEKITNIQDEGDDRIEVSFRLFIVGFTINSFNRRYYLDYPFLVDTLIDVNEIYGFAITFISGSTFKVMKTDILCEDDKLIILHSLSAFKYPTRYTILFEASVLQVR